MNWFQPRTQDMDFILCHVLRAPQRLQQLAPYAEVDADLLRQVLQEAAKFAAQELAPLNRDGDETGARFEHGSVTLPAGFRAAYQRFWQAGWPALATDPADGGQGLPCVLEAQLYEMLSAANHGWTMAPGLLHGAYECLKHHGNAELKAAYLSKIGTGEWLATMCLTEAHAGSDLGLVRTKAWPQADGSYRLNGSKIFISGGEHDLSDNIVHLVLARLPDAPAGPKGLSLFLVPKFYPDGRRSAVYCDRIEEKMGLHASPTCVMRFDDATAWIIGQPGRGLNAMFVMMNAARLHVALQGIGLLEAAWQKADSYAQERQQMRAPVRPQGATEADPIALHPAMRRILDSQRAWLDGGRLLAYRTAIELDQIKHHPDPAQRAAAQRWCSLVTPVIKAVCTHQAFYGASECLQVFGGHGYVREWGIEQHVRDARVAMIYEGTNEIQAIDLLVRKVLPDSGQSLMTLLDELIQELPQAWQADSAQRFLRLRSCTLDIVAAAPLDPSLAFWLADDYLRALGLALLGWAWAQISAHLDGAGADTTRWKGPADAVRQLILPEFEMRCHMLAQRVAAVPQTTPTAA